jgi:hypothetical protein
MVINSSKLATVSTLAPVSAAQAKAFLEELANLSNEQRAIDRFETRYTRFLPWAHSVAQTTRIKEIPLEVTHSETTLVSPGYNPLFALQKALRLIWKAPDQMTKERMIFRFREGDFTTTGSFFFNMLTPWPLTPFEQAVLYLLKEAKLTRHCENPGCSTPYFFAQRRNQKYCSGPCSMPAQREHKRNWWRQHGDQWRKNRVNKRKRRVRSTPKG